MPCPAHDAFGTRMPSSAQVMPSPAHQEILFIILSLIFNLSPIKSFLPNSIVLKKSFLLNFVAFFAAINLVLVGDAGREAPAKERGDYQRKVLSQTNP